MFLSPICRFSIVAAVTCLGCGRLPAAAPNITYTCTGQFSATVVSGSDEFKLAGQQFSIKLVANAATPPTKNGAQWAVYSNLTMTGTVYSGLVPTPFTFSTNSANLTMSVGNPSYDEFYIGAPIKVIGLTINLIAHIQMPPGTITKPLIHPFSAPVTLSSTTTKVIYASGTNSTVLTIAGGTLNGTCPPSVSCAPTTSLLP